MTSNRVELEDVRSKLQEGTSEEEVRLLRKRLVRDAVLAVLSLASPLVFGNVSELWKLFLIIGAVLGAAAFLIRYRRLRPTGPRVVPEAEVAKAAKGSSRCPGCGALVLPAQTGECLRCGRIVNPAEALLTAGIFLALVVGTILWRIYR